MNSTGLSALSQVPTMSNVWLPRWFVHISNKKKNPLLKLRIINHLRRLVFSSYTYIIQ